MLFVNLVGRHSSVKTTYKTFAVYFYPPEPDTLYQFLMFDPVQSSSTGSLITAYVT